MNADYLLTDLIVCHINFLGPLGDSHGAAAIATHYPNEPVVPQ